MRLPSVLALAALLALGGCLQRDRPGWDEVVIARVGASDRTDSRGRLPRGPMTPPYWELRVVDGYLKGVTEGPSVGFHALYPAMESFRPERRDAWFRKKRFGGYGADTENVVDYHLSFRTDATNDVGQLAADNLRRYGVPFEQFKNANGQTVTLTCQGWCRMQSSWNRQIRMEIDIHISLRSRAQEIEARVQELVASFEPKLVSE